MNTNEKGSGVIGWIPIVAIVSLLGFAGWIVWNSDNKAKQSSIDANISSSENDSIATKQLTAGAPTDWNVYQNESLGIGFAYPENWTFEDKSEEQTSTKSWYIGELTSDDESTTIAITLIRKEDERNIRSSIEEWKTYAANANIQFRDLTGVESKYTAFSYILVLDGGVTGLVYQVLETDNNVEMVVLPTETDQKATIDQIIATLIFG